MKTQKSIIRALRDGAESSKLERQKYVSWFLKNVKQREMFGQ